jgi:asparagine synthase (glutamine-hydrolysing)
MRCFLCLLDPKGGRPSETARRSYESLPRARGVGYQAQWVGRVPVLTGGDDNDGDPLVARDGEHVAVGFVRLDNRTELERWSVRSTRGLTDLELVLRTLVNYGTKYVPRILGDFAFVVWNAATQTAVAAVDPFAVRKLYYVERNGLFAFASRGELLALQEQYDVQFLAEQVGAGRPSVGRSVYADVSFVPAATMAVLERGRLVLHQYWSPYDFEVDPTWTRREREAAEVCRQLLTESVQLRLSGNGETWAQLSGGIDSSAVAGIAQSLAERGTVARGLAGTVTYVDRQGTSADEREYSNAVVSRWRLRNETIVDPPLWDDDRYQPPQVDYPRSDFPLYPRELRLCATIQAAGGRVLLTGIGGDELFTGYMYLFADWLARGQVWPAIREMARCAAIGRVSFWEFAYRNAILPVLPAPLRHRLTHAGRDVPAWIPISLLRRYSLDKQTYMASSYAGPIGHKCDHAVRASVLGLGSHFGSGVLADALDVRHPFLYRPLVEFALSLPPELCARPNERKWILREAMRDILPDAVRTRVGKGSPADVLAWSLMALRPLLEPLLHDSILADLGVIDPVKLRAAFDAAPHQPHSMHQPHALVYSTLAIEAWLQMRSGRWPARGRRSSSAAQERAYQPSNRGKL